MKGEEVKLSEELKKLMEKPGAIVGERKKFSWKSQMKICLIISNNYGEKILDNLKNLPGHCNACANKCIGELCKYGKYSFINNIHVIRIPSEYELPTLIEKPEKIIGEKLPNADLVVATSLHNDIYLTLPELLHNAGIKGLLILRSSPQDAPIGVSRQVEENCRELGIEFDNPKPPCLLKPNREKPLIARFIQEFRVGVPLIKLNTVKSEGAIKIRNIEIKISAPCGATWFAARMMLGYELNLQSKKSIDEMCKRVAALHQSYCIASTAHDYELGDTVIHWATYIGIESYLRALNLQDELEKYVRERMRRKLT